jgi:hypothetical protein
MLSYQKHRYILILSSAIGRNNNLGNMDRMEISDSEPA